MYDPEYLSSPLAAVAHWEKATPDQGYLFQPMGGGEVLELSWKEAVEQARRMATYLLSLDLPKGSCIALTGKNTAHWMIADLSIWMAGHVSVPLFPTLSADMARYVLEHCEARLLFVGKLDGITDSWNAVREVLPADLPLVRLPLAPQEDAPSWDDIIAGHEPLQDFVPRSHEELATIIYTSGTTGKPKGVMHNFKSLVAPPNASRAAWDPVPEDRMLSYLPLAHIAERVAVEVPSMLFGFQVYFNESLETFMVDLRRARPTRFFSVPRIWTKFYQGVNAKISPAKQKWLFALPVISGKFKRKILGELGLDSVRIGFTGAAPLPAKIIQWYRDLGLELVEVFGMTENAATSHATKIGEPAPGTVGRPVLGVESRLNSDGEVLVKSPGQMMGYYKMPEETAESMTEDGFFRTGDRGEYDAHGRLRITGRTKDLFKTSKGKYITPVPMENRLGAFPGLEVVCVTGRGLRQPLALVVTAPGTPAPDKKAEFESALAGHLDSVNAQLMEHEQLACLVIVKEPWTIDSGLLTPTLKLRRNQIEARYLDKAEAWVDSGQKIIWEQ
ncbi:MAG TPA: AMP-binding protein [Xanthomonadales bacterium]|nr:AMP-binding protein [Xanthomonadales bacterium]